MIAAEGAAHLSKRRPTMCTCLLSEVQAGQAPLWLRPRKFPPRDLPSSFTGTLSFLSLFTHSVIVFIPFNNKCICCRLLPLVIFTNRMLSAILFPDFDFIFTGVYASIARYVRVVRCREHTHVSYERGR